MTRWDDVDAICDSECADGIMERLQAITHSLPACPSQEFSVVAKLAGLRVQPDVLYI